MLSWKAAVATALCGSVLTLAAAQEKPKRLNATTQTPTLSADDYIEIQQLVARYGFALDTGANDGYMYADLYVPDGVFNTSKGREELAALARGGRRGPFNVRNLSSLAIIKPSPEGATGIQYAQAINFGENRQPTELDHFGHYEDVYVKTADGWRFKSRTFVGESGSLRPQAQQQQTRASVLTAMDQIEIQQLVAQANYALYTGADNGYMYAGLYTSDGAFDRAVGRERLAAFARGGRKGLRSLNTNVIIEPSAGGATGKQYEFVISFVAEGREPVMLGSTGRYEDDYVKTSTGWRFKRRVWLPSISTSEASKVAVRATPPAPGGPQPLPTPESVPLQPPQKGAKPSTLTALDYLEIQQLVASYGHALDSGLGREDNGDAYAGLFAQDGVFGRPYTTGHDELVKLAHTQPHGRQYIRHFLTNMVIEPAPQGAIGRQYLVVVDTAADGKPGSVLIGGHYEDVYVKTAGGWRFRSRTLYPARTGAQAPATPSTR